jgi:hypothetical protein
VKTGTKVLLAGAVSVVLAAAGIWYFALKPGFDEQAG